MRTALKLAVALIAFSSLAYGQEQPLPVAPDSIYHIISPVSESMLEGHDVPGRLPASAWQEDLDTLAAAMRRRIPYFEAATEGNRFEHRLDSLKRVLPQQTRDQRVLSVMRLLNLPATGTGHTRMRTSQRALRWRVLPLWSYRFADGVNVLSSAYPDLIGEKVLAIDGTSIDSVYAALAPYVSADNRWHRQREVEEQMRQLRWVNHLQALGIVEQIDRIPVQLRSENGLVRRVSVRAMAPDSRSYVRFLASTSTRPDPPVALQWSPATRRQGNNEPPYRVSYRDSSDLLYLDFNAVENASDDWTLADLANRLRHIANTRPLEKVVVDLRTNQGGSNQLVGPLIELLAQHPKINQRGTLYTLISPVTYSAAGLFAAELERKTKAIFAGEPTGFAPNMWGEVVPVLLPNTKITVLVSYAYYQGGLPDSPRTSLRPDLHVPLTSSQHFSNVDSTMMAVREHEPEPRDTVSLTPAERTQFTGTYRLSPIHIAHVTDTGEGLHLRVTGESHYLRFEKKGPAVFLESDLYPLSTTQLATDVTDAFLELLPGREALSLAWKDTTYTLARTDPDMKPPIEHIRDGDLKRGAEGLRAALAAGMKLGNNLLEHPFTKHADRLLEQDRPGEALRYVQLAVEFCPTSWRVHADHARVQQALGETGKALRALQKVRELYPPAYDELLELLGLKAAADDRGGRGVHGAGGDPLPNAKRPPLVPVETTDSQ